MTDYNFSHLSSYEFELLCRDLLQKQWSIQLESFKSGKDGGIDLRHCSSTDGTIVVQCKRYVESDFEDLYRELRNDADKVAQLKPSRYAVCTSLGLLPQQKNKILKLFSPFCKTTGDIFGREDLNNILGQNKDLERKHHKLWLHSFEVLRSVHHSSIINFSQAELERIERKRCYYVHTDGFNEALSILQKHRYCVITGIPGIGKTTLAEMLILAHAAHGYEIIKVSEDIDEAFSVHSKDTKQLFYYDDFLGQTGLQTKLGKNEDDRLIGFITLVGNSKKTRFILTTREYILKQAQADYERLSKFDFEKCVLEPPKYTEYQRARILYNHLFFSNLPAEYRAAILKNRGYLKIANHRGFNPRLISLMTEAKTVASIAPDQYVKRFLAHLDNPEDIWSHAFEHQISESAKNVLLVLVSMPNGVLLEDVQVAFNAVHYSRVTRYSLQAAPQDFRNALNELEDTFLRIEKTNAEDAVIIQFHNPSVRDFLENYLAGSETDTVELAEFAKFFEQLEFLCAPASNERVRRIIRRHTHGTESLAQVLISCFDSRASRLHHSRREGFDGWTETRQPWSIEGRLWLVIKIISSTESSTLSTFVSSKLRLVHANVIEREVDRQELIELIEALDDINYSLLNTDEWRESFLSDCQEFLCEDLSEFYEYKMVAESIKKTSAWSRTQVRQFRYQFEDFFSSECDDLPEDYEYEDKVDSAREIANILGISLDSELDDLEERRERFLKKEKRTPPSSPSRSPVQDPKTEIQLEIIAMFEGLS